MDPFHRHGSSPLAERLLDAEIDIDSVNLGVASGRVGTCLFSPVRIDIPKKK